MLREIGGHLERRIHCKVERQLIADGSIDMRLVGRAIFLHVHHEDSRGIIHRTAVETGERKNRDVLRVEASKSLILSSFGGFVAYHVRVGAAQARRTDSLMRIDHDMMLGRLADGVLVMIVHVLAIVVLAARENLAHVTGLDRVIAVLVHEVVGGIHVTLVIPYG